MVDFSLYLITDRMQTAGRALPAVVADALNGGLRALQLREKDLGTYQLFELAGELRKLTREYGARLLINDRLDVALAVGADGVQLGRAGLPVSVARRLLGGDKIIGYSAHSLDEARRAEHDGADFVTFGPSHIMTIPPDTPTSPHIHKELRIHSYGHYLRRRFGCRVSKVNVDAGFTCPNRDGSKGTGGCIYCNNVSFSPKDTHARISLEEQLAHGIAYHRRRLGSEKFIVYFQKYTNTYASVDVLEDLYRRALAYPDVIGISVGTRPDALSDAALALLAEIATTRYVCLELGLQSMDDAILMRINRGHTLEDFVGTVQRAAGHDFDICAHLIYGFPGETPGDFLKTADLIASLPVDSIKLHQLHVVEGTELAAMYRREEFTPITLPEYVTTAADFLERLPAHVTVQRLYGSAPLAICVAPRWGLKNNQMWFAVINELRRRGTWQGCRVQ